MAYLSHEILELSYDDQFQVISNGLENAKTTELTNYLSVFNYDKVRIDEGITLLETARTLHTKQQVEFGEQLSATTMYNEMRKAIETRVSATWKIAKISITDRGMKRTLGIDRNRLYTKSGFAKQFEQFYRNLDTKALELLGKFGYTAEKIAEEQQLIRDLIAADKTQDDETSEAQAATFVRDEAIDLLHEWCRSFYTVAKIALADNPQLLEKIGIIAR